MLTTPNLLWPEHVAGATEPDRLTPERLRWGLVTGKYLDGMVNRGDVSKAAKYAKQGFCRADVEDLLELAERLVGLGGRDGLVNARQHAAEQLRAALISMS